MCAQGARGGVCFHERTPKDRCEAAGSLSNTEKPAPRQPSRVDPSDEAIERPSRGHVLSAEGGPSPPTASVPHGRTTGCGGWGSARLSADGLNQVWQRDAARHWLWLACTRAVCSPERLRPSRLSSPPCDERAQQPHVTRGYIDLRPKRVLSGPRRMLTYDITRG